MVKDVEGGKMGKVGSLYSTAQGHNVKLSLETVGRKQAPSTDHDSVVSSAQQKCWLTQQT